MSWHYGWRPYVPVAVRRARAAKKVDKLRKKGMNIRPVEIEGRKIAQTFWGEAWCDHLEKFSDFANRLPRGRTYVRNGSVCHLEIGRGVVNAMVTGSKLYNVKVAIKKLPKKKWKGVKDRCAGRIGSLLELLQGRLSKDVMAVVTDRNDGLFPHPGEIILKCNCPDWAVMCKHVAAVLYGVGARLDEKPELLFLLRGVDQEELIVADAGVVTAATAGKDGGRRRIADGELTDVFGIELADEGAANADGSALTRTVPSKARKQRRKKTSAGKAKTFQPGERMTRKAGSKTGKPRKRERTRVSGTTRSTRPISVSRKRNAKNPVRAASKTKFPTGKAASRLRKKFGMSKIRFARLLGVSASTIGNWENTEGCLNLQVRTRRAWLVAKDLSEKEAWKRLVRT